MFEFHQVCLGPTLEWHPPNNTEISEIHAKLLTLSKSPLMCCVNAWSPCQNVKGQRDVLTHICMTGYFPIRIAFCII